LERKQSKTSAFSTRSFYRNLRAIVERFTYYLSQAVTRQGERGGDWMFELKPVYGVFFMNFRLQDTPGKLRSDIVLSDRDTHEQFTDKLRFIFIELPCFTKEEQECETDFERWIYILKNMETLKRIPFKTRKAAFEKLEKIADIASLSKEEREKYDESIKVYRDHLATIAYAQQEGRAKGIAEGRAEGRVEGRVEGEAEGRAKGIIEGKTETARNMKAEGLSLPVITKITGLSAEEIEKL